MGEDGLKILAAVAGEEGMPFVVEVLKPAHIELALTYGADALRIGARNAQSSGLLTEVGQAGVPVIHKRGPGMTYKEWLLAVEFIAVAGCVDIILCERGVNSLDQHVRYMLDVMAVPALHALTHLPVMADPSHGTGVKHLVAPGALAAVAAGADAIIIDVHADPVNALVDGAHALLPEEYTRLTAQIRPILEMQGRRMDGFELVA
jgi:3-deoxy-7-phosphoheptulonate synthase